MSRIAFAAALVLAAVASSCGSTADRAPPPTTAASSDSAAGNPAVHRDTESPVPPVGRVLPTPDPLPPGEPGDVIASEAFGWEGNTGWRVLYRSRSVAGRDIAISGLVFAPSSPAPPGGRPVVAWAHGTTGLGDQCAPSRSPADVAAAASVGQLLSRGLAVVATDYEGLGTPADHPYLVGPSEARSVIDSVRAASRLPDVGAGRRFVVVGHSQGGGAALFTGEVVSSYAPELELAGVVAAAPAAELSLLGGLSRSPFFAYAVMAIFGLHAAYPDLALDAVLTAAAIADKPKVTGACLGEIFSSYRNRDPAQVIRVDPASIDPWAAALERNSPGNAPTPSPVLIVHGASDEQVPAFVSQLLLRRMCGHGATVERRLYPGANHTGVLAAANSDILAWVEARLAGRSAASSC